MQPGQRGRCSCSGAVPERLRASTHGGSASWARQQRGSKMSGWRFKTAADSSKMLTKRSCVRRLARQCSPAREGFAVAQGPCPSGSPPLLMAPVRAGLASQRGSEMSGWRFKTAADSSKILTKLSLAWRLARQCSPARESFAAVQATCKSGCQPLLMAAVRAGLVSQRGSEMSGWRFKTAAHSSKMLTKLSRVRRLARQCSPAREGFAAAQGPRSSGSAPLLMAAARAGLLSECVSDMI